MCLREEKRPSSLTFPLPKPHRAPPRGPLKKCMSLSSPVPISLRSMGCEGRRSAALSTLCLVRDTHGEGEWEEGIGTGIYVLDCLYFVSAATRHTLGGGWGVRGGGEGGRTHRGLLSFITARMGLNFLRHYLDYTSGRFFAASSSSRESAKPPPHHATPRHDLRDGQSGGSKKKI